MISNLLVKRFVEVVNGLGYTFSLSADGLTSF
jgi:hypothetical protein